MWNPQRNDILYRRQNSYHAEENEQLAERLMWYADNMHVILLHNDQYLALHDLIRIAHTRRAKRQEWIKPPFLPSLLLMNHCVLVGIKIIALDLEGKAVFDARWQGGYLHLLAACGNCFGCMIGLELFIISCSLLRYCSTSLDVMPVCSM